MRKIFTIIVAIACAAGGVSCTKPVVRTDYRLTVTWQERKAEKEPQPLVNASAYAFFVNPDQWVVASIEDARNGIITSVADPSNKQTYDMEGVRGGDNRNVFTFEFDTEPVMLVVADNRYPMWATGNANVVPNLSNLYVDLNFTPLDWKEGNTEPVVKGPWKFYGYGNVKIPIDTELKIIASVTPKGQTSAQKLTSAQCYAFYDFAKGEGRVTSWRQAMGGTAEKLVSEAGEEGKEETYEDVSYNARGEWSSDTLRIKITNPNVMVVVYNETADPADTKMYAYGFFDFSANPYSEESSVSFDLRKESDSWVSGVWNIELERPLVTE